MKNNHFTHLPLCVLLIILFLTSCKTENTAIEYKNQTVNIDNGGNKTPVLLSKSNDFELLVDKPLEINSISLNFGNFNSDKDKYQYELNMTLLLGGKTLYEDNNSYSIKDNQWHVFKTNKINLDPGKYKLRVKYEGDKKLAIWTKNKNLWAIIN